MEISNFDTSKNLSSPGRLLIGNEGIPRRSPPPPSFPSSFIRRCVIFKRGRGLFGGKFCSRFICSLSLLEREVGLIAEWNMEVQRGRFVPGNIFSIKEECSPISRYRCVPLIALASVFNIFSMESRLLFSSPHTLVACPSLIPADIYFYIWSDKSCTHIASGTKDHFVSNIIFHLSTYYLHNLIAYLCKCKRNLLVRRIWINVLRVL